MTLFLIIQPTSESPQVKRYLIHEYHEYHDIRGTRVASQDAEQLKDLRKLGNIRNMSNVCVDAAQCSVPPAETKR